MTDTIVIGAGLAGLTAAIRLAQGGASVTLLTFGTGGIPLGQGTVDVLGYSAGGQLLPHPFDELARGKPLPAGHPYRALLPAQIRDAVDWFAGLVPGVLAPGDGSNHLVPTALGAMRPTYLVPPSFVWPAAARVVAVVGPRQIKDFCPELVAGNLAATAGVKTAAYHIDLPARAHEAESSPVVYAQALDDPRFLARFAQLVRVELRDADAVVLPAVLGLHRLDVPARLAGLLGRPIVEAVLPPPSIPGMRLNAALTSLATTLDVRMVAGSRVTGYSADGRILKSVTLHQAGRDQQWAARDFVYAPGGFESGALAVDSFGHVAEVLFDLPLAGTSGPLVGANYRAKQRLFGAGVTVDAQMRPLRAKHPAYDNLRAAGGILAGAQRWDELSGDGIAIAGAVRAADSILEEVARV